MSIRSAYMIVAATTLALCPVPGEQGPKQSRESRPPAARTAAPASPTSPAPTASLPVYPPHAPPVTSRPTAPGGGGAGRPGGNSLDGPPPPVYDRRYGGTPTASAPPRGIDSPAPPPGGPWSADRTAPPAATVSPRTSAPPAPGPTAGADVSAQADPKWGTPVLVENFDGTQIDRGKWDVYHSPGAAVNPRTSQATTVHDGMLHMTGGFYGGQDLSGGVAGHLAQTYGRWEVRFRGEPGRGYSLVTLLWPDSQSPEYTEIDFAEVIDASRQTGGIFIHRGESRQAQSLMRADFTQWHTVAVDWLPGRLTFWLDGRKTWDYTGPNVPPGRPMHLTLQNDVVCNQWSPCRDSTTPATVSMFVDWVKIYRAP
ncbi:family 16 glycosylhydrolase [Sphaerisporangium sp. NPDC051017]|uniref:glycoside hydrolase family 16 protein n=1 Tax=Sphaerisporangium sp. NPDC051017 TaxID=3154636 RepID=UPI00343BE7F1